MVKNIKRVAHDLTPLSEAIVELGSIITSLHEIIKPDIYFNNPQAEEHFNECSAAMKNLIISAQLITNYVRKLHQEADNSGITKD